MKIKNLFLIAVFIIVSGSINSTYANAIKDDAFTILDNVGAINSIEVHGNVELFVTDAPADVIKVYNKYYAEGALVQNRNGVLRISSYTNERLVIWVKAKDLRSVSLFDNSQIKSFGTLSKIEFNVDLHDNAQAKLSLDAIKLNLLVRNNAKADIKGNAEELILNRDVDRNVARKDLAVMHLFENKNVAVISTSEQINAI